MLDKGAISLGITGGQGDHACRGAGPLRVTNARQRREFSGGELADAFGNGFNHIGRGGGEAFMRADLADARIDLHRKDLIGGGGGKVHGTGLSCKSSVCWHADYLFRAL